MKNLIKKLKKTQSKISKIMIKRYGSTISHNELPALKAFVVFEHLEHRN